MRPCGEAQMAMTVTEFEMTYPEYAFDFTHRLRDQPRIYGDDPGLANLPTELAPIDQDRVLGAPGPGKAPPRNQTRTHYQCAVCKRVLRNDQFVAGPSWREGNKQYPYCKSCRSANTRRYTGTETARRREDRRKRLSYELGKIITPHCVYCGFDGHPAAIELHHVDMSAKDSQIAPLMATFAKGRNPRFAEAIRAEANKCVPLCSNCHRLVHYGAIVLEVNYPVPEWSVEQLMTVADRLWKDYSENK